jgi:Uma2 family endonuclease
MADYIKKNECHYTYTDYIHWPDEERWEIIHGIPYDMSPAPIRKHQRVLGILFNRFFNFLEGKSCTPYIAPFDVRLPEGEETGETSSTVVQPDLSVYCDADKLDEKGAVGAPDLVVEVLSPSTSLKDIREKYYLYERHGVKEYWLVHPTESWVEILKRKKDNKLSRREVYGPGDEIEVEMFPGLVINLKDVFELPDNKELPSPGKQAVKNEL